MANRKLTKFEINRKVKILQLLKLKLLVSRLSKKYKKKRFWVRNIYQNRSTHSYFFTLMSELREKNCNEETNEKFFNYIRMYPVDFDELLASVEHLIRKIDFTRKTISPGEKLAMALR